MDDNFVVRGAPPWTKIPTAMLRAEFQRRQKEPAKPICGGIERGAYDTPAHVAALILILSLSTIACGFPLVSRRASKSKGPNRFVFYSQHFGTGVLIATAFVHLLPTAFISLTDPCLPWIWNRGYKPMAGVIAMASALVVVGIEMFLRTRGAGHSHSHSYSWESVSTRDQTQGYGRSGVNGTTGGLALKKSSYRQGKLGMSHRPTDISLGDIGSSEGLIDGLSPLPGSTPLQNGNTRFHDDDEDSDLDLEELDPAAEANGDAEIQPVPPTSTGLTAKEEKRRLLIQCLLLEAGILFHSVFIGMAISVATGSPFVVFLIAISFHQSFEGLALGSRIAAINFSRSSPKPWIMVLAYGTTTPIGQAIGLIVHRLYDPHSEAGLLIVGVMNAISSGLLLFAGLVQLLAEDFLSDKSYDKLKGRRRWHAFLAVVGGAALMAFVGAWS